MNPHWHDHGTIPPEPIYPPAQFPNSPTETDADEYDPDDPWA